jgi:hypothetical protein
MVAENGTLDMVKLTYEAYPEAVKYWSGGFATPLHQAVSGNSVENMEYLYSRYTNAVKLVTRDKETLLHMAMGRSFEVIEKAFSYFPEAIKMKSEIKGSLPLHTLVEMKKAILENGRPVARNILSCRNNCNALEALRLLLKHYPEAAGIDDDDENCPYDYVHLEENTELAQRLLLRAAPYSNPPELRRLNYMARRGALYLLFVAQLPPDWTAEVGDKNLVGQSSAEVATGTMMAAPRRSARKKRETNGHTMAHSSSSSLSLHPQTAAASSKIWRLLKGRAVAVLLKEIVLYL